MEQGRWADVATVCAKLRNLCIDGSLLEVPLRHPRNVRFGQEHVVHDNEIFIDEYEVVGNNARRGNRVNRRFIFTTELENIGIDVCQ